MVPKDRRFIDTLHGHVISWINAMQAVTNLLRDVSQGLHRKKPISARLEQAFESCEAQLRSEEISMAWSVYRQLNGFHATNLDTAN